MTRKSFVLAAALTLTATAFAWTQLTAQSANDALDPVRVAADTHKVAFENAFVRVLESAFHPERVSRDIGIRTD